jgi:hypothetical protein
MSKKVGVMKEDFPKYVNEREFDELKHRFEEIKSTMLTSDDLLKHRLEELKSTMLTRDDLDSATHIETGTIKWSWKSEFPNDPDRTPDAGCYFYDVKFKKPFLSEPLVLLSFACLDANTNDRPFHINSKIEELSVSGFRVNIEAWGNTKLFRLRFRWSAFTRNENCIDHGECNAKRQSTSGCEPD